MARVAVGATFALALLSLWPSAAFAAQRCDSAVLDDGSVVRVATLRAPCENGREIARAFFERIQRGDDFDGKTGDGSVFYAVGGFRCFPGLGGSQVWCRRHKRRWVFASTRPEDHPAGWTPLPRSRQAPS